MRHVALISLTLLLFACSSPSSPSGTTTSGSGSTGSGSGTASVAGVWTGVATQPAGPSGQRFDYRLSISQSGSTLSGMARIELQTATGRYFAEYNVTGRIDASNAVQITETTITSQQPPPGAVWCLKTETLTYSPAQNRLAGPWSAPGCVPGEIDLRR